MEQPEEQQAEEQQAEEQQPEEQQPEERPRDDPTPEPGTTAPLDDLTEEEKKSGPMGVMPGAGPEPDDIRHSGVEEQEEREDEKEAETDG